MADATILPFSQSEPDQPLNDPLPEPERHPLTRGERLVGLSEADPFLVKLAKHRHARTIDALGNLPLAQREHPTVTGGKGLTVLDMDHKLAIERAIEAEVEASMWAVRALSWGR